MSRALNDLLVLDATASFWASMGAGLLADFGADVIRLDGLGGLRGETASPEEAQSLHELANRNKRSIALDVSTQRGREVFERLLARAGVFVTDATTAALESSKLDYASLARVRADVIYARCTGFGPGGPDRDLPALDELAAARTGMMPILPQPGQPPVYTGAGQMYSSVMVAFGVMLALWHRTETGQGQEVDASLFAGNMYGASLDLQAFLAMGGARFLQPVSRLDAGNPMSGTLYPTSDGRWVTLTMPDTDRWWPALAEITGLDANDPRLDSHEQRCEENRLLLIELLERAFQQKPAAHWRTVIDERGLSADVIEEYSYPANDPQALRNRFVIELSDPARGSIKTLGFPLFMSDSPARLSRQAPSAGQHTAEVLRETLGCSEDDITRLQEDGNVR